MNRRSILSTLCTGALALLAPVAALAKPCRRVRFRNFGVPPMSLARDGKWYRTHIVWNQGTGAVCESWRTASFPSGPTGEYPCSKCGQPTLHDEPDPNSLRALLAEARDMIYENVMVRRFRIGTGEATYEGYLQDTLAQADLHTRIDAALKGHEHA